MQAGRIALGGIAVVGLIGCDLSLSSYDEIYARGAEQYVMCAQNIDSKSDFGIDDIDGALMRAKVDGTTLQLYAHRPGATIEVSALEAVLAAANQRGTPFATYEELSAGEVPGSLALAFDDHHLEAWMAIRPLLDRYHARVTFFISAYTRITDEDRAAVRTLADDGHDIEFHSVGHLDAEAYSNEHGVDAYLADEILPALDAMRAAGYATTVFAYPFGTRNAATDAALAPYFSHIRAIRSTCPHS